MVVIIGNIIGFIASILMLYAGVLKEKKQILIAQTTETFLSVICNILLGGISGAIINTIHVFRNILCYKEKLNIVAKIIITIVTIPLSLVLNNRGIIGILPIISSISYVWLMNVKDIRKFKLLIAFSMTLWFIYDFKIKLYTVALFDLATIIANLITMNNNTRIRRMHR